MDIEDDEESNEESYKSVREELIKEIRAGDTILLVYRAGPVEFRVKQVHHKGRYFKGRMIGQGKELNERKIDFEDFIKYGTIL